MSAGQTREGAGTSEGDTGAEPVCLIADGVEGTRLMDESGCRRMCADSKAPGWGRGEGQPGGQVDQVGDREA